MGRLRTPRLVQVIVAVAWIVAGIGIAAYRSGKQVPIDAVAVTKHRDGIGLESSLVPANGIQLHVVQAGPKDGPPVVLLHGYPEFWWAWHEQIARLARAGFHVIAPDQRGYNGSDKPSGIAAYRVELLIQDILSLIEVLGYDRVDLAGHDWGGAIAWYLVIEHPEHFRRLVMFNAPHPLAWQDAARSQPDEEPINWFRTFFQIPVLPEMVGYAGNWALLASNLRNTSRAGTFPDADMDLYRWAWFRDGSSHAMVNWYRAAFRYPYELRGDGIVKVPTRIVWGMRDRFFENRLARLSVPHCADGELFEIADAGHWLLHEEPEVTSAKMIEFFSRP